MPTISEIRKRIVEALQLGQDTSSLEKQLKFARQEEFYQVELSALRAIALQRQEWQGAALAVEEKVKLQSLAIDNFLEARDNILPLLRVVVEQVEILKQLQPACFEQYNRYSLFDVTKGIPVGFLPDDFTMAILEHNKESPAELSEAALLHLQRAYDALAGAQKSPIKPLPGQPVTDGLDDGREIQEVTEESHCSICMHPEREAIDKALAEGVSLRDVEAQYSGTSRSSLSRHKAHLENIS